MKQFSCSNLGMNCNATLMAPTEERLLDMVALHARDVHGMIAISQETLGKIKQLFVNRSAPDAANVVDRVLEKYNCDSDPECTWRYIAEAEMILTGNQSVHEKELKAA